MSSAVEYGRFSLERRLAVGGMAEIFLANQRGPEGFEKRVVLKRIHASLCDDPDAVAMFLDEARLVARFDHPNLIRAYELTQVSGQFVLVMEYLEGSDLGELIKAAIRASQPVPYHFVAFIIAGAAEGLRYAHNLTNSRGQKLSVVHRDISPSNIVVTDTGDIKIVDFGIAKHSQRRSEETQYGVVKGKYAYFSPEQARGDSLSASSDVFSLGVTAYELLTLTRCFKRDSPIETARAVTDGDYVPVRELVPDAPTALVDTIEAMLRPSASERPTTHELASRLGEAIPDQMHISAATLGTYVVGMLSNDHKQQWYTSSSSSDEVKVSGLFAEPSTLIDSAAMAELTLVAQPMSATVETAPVEIVIPPQETLRNQLKRAHILAMAASVLAASAVGLALILFLQDRERTLPEGIHQPLRIEQGLVQTSEANDSQQAPKSQQEQESQDLAWISITTEPKVSVSVDGRDLGTSPVVAAPLEPGEHVFLLHDSSVGIKKRFRQELESSERSSRKFEFKKVEVWVRTRGSPAEVFVDGRSRGLTPLRLRGVYEGWHTVRLENGDASVVGQRNINIRPGAILKVTANAKGRNWEWEVE